MANSPLSFMNVFTSPDDQAKLLQLQQQQKMAEELMKQGQTQIDPNRSSGKYVTPVSPWEGLAKIGQSGIGAYLQHDANTERSALQSRQIEALKSMFGAGGTPGQNEMPTAPLPDNLNPEGVPDQTVTGTPTIKPQALAQGLTQGGAGMTLPGMTSRQAMLRYSLSPEKYMEQLYKNEDTSTDFTKMLRVAGIDPATPLGKQLIQSNLAKQNHVAPTAFRPGVPVRDPFDPSKVVAFNPELPPGSNPQFDAQGNVSSVSQIPGAAGVIGANKSAEQGAIAAQDLVEVPRSDGSSVRMPRDEAVRALRGAPQQPQSPSSSQPLPSWSGVNGETRAARPQRDAYASGLVANEAGPPGAQQPQSGIPTQNVVGRDPPPSTPQLGVTPSPEERARQTNYGGKQGELEAARPQATLHIQSATNSLDRLAAEASSLLTMPGLGGITAVRGAFPDMPGSGAANARARMETLKSQIANSVLQSMREASATGGAVGQVSNFEQQLFINNIAALNTAQSEDALKASLRQIVGYTQEAKGRLTNAFNMQYGSPSQQQDSRQPAGQPIPAAKVIDWRSLPGGR